LHTSFKLGRSRHPSNEYAKLALTHSRSTDATAKAYAIAWNTGAANNILRRLPNELKNMIYEELVHIHQRVDVEMGDYRHSTRSIRYRYGSDSASFPPLATEDYPHYFHLTYMGTTFATGLSAVFHSVAKFSIKHQEDLPGLLSKERFGTTIVPSEHIRLITINVSLEGFNISTGETWPWAISHYEFPLKKHFLKAVERLKIMLTVPCKRGSKLCLRVDCRQHNPSRKFAEVLFPLVYDLKDKGWLIQVEGHGYMPKDEQRVIQDFDYQISREEWKKRASSNSAFVRNTARPHVTHGRY